MKPTICLLLVVVFALSTAQAQQNFARRGVIDLRGWDISLQPYVELNGEWNFYMSELLSPADLHHREARTPDNITFPSTWNKQSKSLNPGNGFATYQLAVLLNGQKNLALEIPHFYSSYRLWVNGEEIASNGKVGKTKEDSRPQWLPNTIRVESTADSLNILIQVSNFHHAKGGVREPLRLGDRGALEGKRELAVASTAVMCGGLIVIALTFIAVFFFRTERSALFFAALCLTWAVRESFADIYIFTAAYPDIPWEVALRIEYVTLYLTMIWGVLLLSTLFPQDVSTLFKYLLVGCNLIFLLLTLLSPTTLFTQFLPVYLSTAAVLLLYVVYVLIHAIVNDRKGVWAIVGCIMLGVIVFAYDLISYGGFTSYNSLITHGGYIGMFLMMALCLAIQYGFVKRGGSAGDVLTYDELYRNQRK